MTTQGQTNRQNFYFDFETCLKTVNQSGKHCSNERETNLVQTTSKNVKVVDFTLIADDPSTEMSVAEWKFPSSGQQVKSHCDTSSQCIRYWLLCASFLLFHTLLSVYCEWLRQWSREWPWIQRNGVKGRPDRLSRTPLFSLFMLGAKYRILIGERWFHSS